MVLDKALRLVLLSFLENKVTVASWGISNIVIEPSSLAFTVDGIKYKGVVNIKVTGSTYTLQMGNMSYSVTLENLVPFMDNKIECTTNYLFDLLDWVEGKGI